MELFALPANEIRLLLLEEFLVESQLLIDGGGRLAVLCLILKN
jgi:hypothetical protein